MRRTLEETTALLEQLPANQQQTAPVQVPIQQPVQQQQQCIAPTNVRPGQGLIGTPGSRPDSPAGRHSPPTSSLPQLLVSLGSLGSDY